MRSYTVKSGRNEEVKCVSNWGRGSQAGISMCKGSEQEAPLGCWRNGSSVGRVLIQVTDYEVRQIVRCDAIQDPHSSYTCILHLIGAYKSQYHLPFLGPYINI